MPRLKCNNPAPGERPRLPADFAVGDDADATDATVHYVRMAGAPIRLTWRCRGGTLLIVVTSH
jgi:hypothetical protein